VVRRWSLGLLSPREGGGDDTFVGGVLELLDLCPPKPSQLNRLLLSGRAGACLLAERPDSPLRREPADKIEPALSLPFVIA